MRLGNVIRVKGKDRKILKDFVTSLKDNLFLLHLLYISVSQPFLVPLLSISDIRVAPLASLTGIKDQATPLALVQGTLVCRGTPVGNHCSVSSTKNAVLCLNLESFQ
jgi:hypothetical protein